MARCIHTAETGKTRDKCGICGNGYQPWRNLNMRNAMADAYAKEDNDAVKEHRCVMLYRMRDAFMGKYVPDDIERAFYMLADLDMKLAYAYANTYLEECCGV